MAGIRIMEHSSGEIRSHPAIWAGPEEVPVVFVVVKDGATGLAHPDYIDGVLYEVAGGDLKLADAWDDLLVKTPDLPYPQKCRVRMVGNAGAAEILVRNRIVHKFT